MGKINIGRVLLGTLAAGIFYFIADGLIHGAVLAGEYLSAFKNLNLEVKEDPAGYGYFALFDLGKAFVAVMIYALARPRLGAGVRTAIWAGVLAWLACEVVPGIAEMPFPFFPKWYHVKLMALELVPMVLGAILGAWIYRE